MFKHILLPTDGSELSAATIQQGIRFAKSIGAKVTGLCVMPLRHTLFCEMEIPTKAQEQAAKRCKERAETYLTVIEKDAEEARIAYDVFMRGTIIPMKSSSGWLSRKVATSS